MCGACGSGADSAGECVLKEQPGQLWTSATAALRAVNAAWLEKENKLPGLSIVLEVCCPNAIAPEGIERRKSQLRQTRAPLPPPIIRYTLLFPLARSSDNAGKERKNGRGKQSTAVRCRISPYSFAKQSQYSKRQGRCNRTIPNPCL